MYIFNTCRSITLLSLAGLLLFCTPAFAQDPLPSSPRPIPLNSAPPSGAVSNPNAPSVDPQQRAELLLSGYHGHPPKSVLDGNLKAPQKVLMDVARGEDTLPLQRQRALEALGYYADARVEALYADLLRDKTTPEMLRHRVMSLMAIHFPQTALSALDPFLTHPDLQFRLSAIDAVRRLPGGAAQHALQKAAKSESHKVAQQRLAQYLRAAR